MDFEHTSPQHRTLQPQPKLYSNVRFVPVVENSVKLEQKFWINVLSALSEMKFMSGNVLPLSCTHLDLSFNLIIEIFVIS